MRKTCPSIENRLFEGCLLGRVPKLPTYRAVFPSEVIPVVPRNHMSGQIIPTKKKDRLAPKNVVFWKGNGTPAISGKSRSVKYHDN